MPTDASSGPGTLEHIWIKRGAGAPMDAVSSADARAGRGLVGNANQGGKRQVTILAREEWAAFTAAFPALDPKIRRANLLVSGVALRDARGKTLRVGAVRIKIHGETRPCEQMDDAAPGLRAALSPPWGGGAFGEVLDDGVIAVGDRVSFE